MKKKIVVAVVVALSLLLLPLVGCGGSDSGDGGAAPSAVVGGGPDDAVVVPVVVVVGASPVPHTEILEFVKDKMAAEGYELRIRQFTDYVQPNLATESGELDANFFQHVPYMENFNNEYGTRLVPIFPVHFEPLGLYRSRTKTIGELQDGAIIAIPNDVTNAARAFQLLEAAGLIKLREDAGINATRLDIVENPRNIDIRELEAAQIPLLLPDMDMAVINGNFALQAGLSMDEDAVAAEAKDSLSAVTYTNHIVVKVGNEHNAGILALIEALSTSEVRDMINEKYEGVVVPVF